ncbi:Rieske (2Fe-2S) protein [Streptomyces shenzhenensis]|uniref:Rieske (2Fe-2S) protein n=1 Tax=Streptomyces shenzhenensis TaxID=943815 RepID=UPI0036B79744
MPGKRFVVGRATDLADGEKMAVDVNGRSIAIFNVRGKFYGLLNRCPHRGADLCAGRFLPLVSAERPGEYVYDTDHHLLACPWHGWEFDVTTGQSYVDPVGMRGRPYGVDVEKGSLVATEVASGAVSMTPAHYAAATAGQNAGDGKQPGPYKAETVTIEVEDDYLVVDLRPRRPGRRTAS